MRGEGTEGTSEVCFQFHVSCVPVSAHHCLCFRLFCLCSPGDSIIYLCSSSPCSSSRFRLQDWWAWGKALSCPWRGPSWSVLWLCPFSCTRVSSRSAQFGVVLLTLGLTGLPLLLTWNCTLSKQNYLILSYHYDIYLGDRFRLFPAFIWKLNHGHHKVGEHWKEELNFLLDKSCHPRRSRDVPRMEKAACEVGTLDSSSAFL